MSIFDIVGPVMVGPSSSHTAGAVRIGYICYKLIDEPIRKVEIGLYGSFLATGKGHGTDKALVAGLLGMKPDDIRVPESFELAEQHDRKHDPDDPCISKCRYKWHHYIKKCISHMLLYKIQNR